MYYLTLSFSFPMLPIILPYPNKSLFYFHVFLLLVKKNQFNEHNLIGVQVKVISSIMGNLSTALKMFLPPLTAYRPSGTG